eukprot:4041172-Prorocentrum_lima.AAC.1
MSRLFCVSTLFDSFLYCGGRWSSVLGPDLSSGAREGNAELELHWDAGAFTYLAAMVLSRGNL